MRHTYGSRHLTTVGGGVRKGETLEQAVAREVMEEVGIFVQSIQKVGVVKTDKEYKDDTIHVYLSQVDDQIVEPRSAEIAEARWYPITNLPPDVSPLFTQFVSLATPALKALDKHHSV